MQVNYNNTRRLFGNIVCCRRRENTHLFVLENIWIVFVLFLASSFYWWGRISIGYLKVPLVIFFLPFIGLLWIYSSFFKRTSYINNHFLIKTTIPLLVMIWAMGASLINHENVSDGLSSLCELISYTALYFLMVKTIRTERGLIRIAISLMIIITYFALEGLYRLFITKSIWRLGAGDVNTATNMGAFMFQALILLLASRIIIDQKQSKESKVAYTIILGSIIFAFVFTYSRGAWITLLVGGLILMHKRSKAIILAILLFIIIFPFLPKEISNRFLSTFNTKNLSFIELYRGAQINNTTYLRLANWSNTLDDIVEHPMLGVGVGYYHGEEKGEDAPHNTYLRLWAEGGPVALAGFLWFLASLVYSFVSSSQTAKGRSNWLLMGFYSVVLTHIFYLFLGDWAYQIYFWVFAGLSTATLKIYHHLYVIKHLQKETGHKAISS